MRKIKNFIQNIVCVVLIGLMAYCVYRVHSIGEKGREEERELRRSVYILYEDCWNGYLLLTRYNTSWGQSTIQPWVLQDDGTYAPALCPKE